MSIFVGGARGWPFSLGQEQVRRWQDIYRGRVSANAARPDFRAAQHLPGERLHLVGAFAEAAMEMLEGAPVRCPVHVGPGIRAATAGPDLGRWAVKGTECPGGRLMENAGLLHKFLPEAPYVLVLCNLEGFSGLVAGWRWGHEFLGRPECLVVRGLKSPAFVAPAPLRPYGPPGAR